MDSLGLSIGATNMVAVRAGQPPVRRRSVLTVFPHRPAEVGLPGENPDLTESGLVLWGFADRVGDPVPIVAPDGSSHRAIRQDLDQPLIQLHRQNMGSGLNQPLRQGTQSRPDLQHLIGRRELSGRGDLLQKI